MTKSLITLPKSTYRKHIFDPAQYILSDDLRGALDVALALEQPLLLTGEPGTGKTLLAYKIAHDLSRSGNLFLPEPLVFHTKTTSTAQDLFYEYDAMRHFHDANLQKAAGKEAPAISKYLEMHALGKAIAMSNLKEVGSKEFVATPTGEPMSSVVLIDEIDKAPRDFPNDILHEIDRFEFSIKEAHHHRIQKGNDARIVVVMTSNSEKNLPEAFLRRCIFYHIPFPKKDQLMAIVNAQFGGETAYSSERLIQHFERIREAIKKKKPATAELISWLRILELNDFWQGNVNLNRLNASKKQILKLSYSVLAKNKEDLALIEKQFLS